MAITRMLTMRRPENRRCFERNPPAMSEMTKEELEQLRCCDRCGARLGEVFTCYMRSLLKGDPADRAEELLPAELTRSSNPVRS